MQLRILPSVLLFTLSCACAATDSPKADIQKVVEQFQVAIKAHDAGSLSGFFLTGQPSWYTTLGEPSYSSVKAKHPEVPRYKAGSLRDFTDLIGKPSASIEERFRDVRIDSDGAVASVYFNFEFVEDGKVMNHGAETWQMIHTNDGWKIAAMVYSSNF
jgi:hypothetical protein